MRWFFLLFYVILLILETSGSIGPSLVHTSLGDVQGIANAEDRHFLGIPFAEPPVDSLRFRQAVPKKPWQDVYDATKFKPACLQPGLRDMSEDCLYLQVYTPSDIPSGKLLPVLFWIHGGSFSTGSGAEYNGTNFAKQDTLVVTINYRLNVFGYLQSLELSKEDPEWPSLGGMNGINDQLVALKWTINNIAAFGGDPDDITISGESAGSLSVCMLLVSPHSKDMFNNAILESGSCIGPWGPVGAKQGLQVADDFMYNVGVKTVEELRQLDVATIIAADEWASFFPSIDEFWLMKLPIELFKIGELSVRKGGRFLLGSNTQDTLFGLPFYAPPGAPTTYESYRLNIENYFGPSKNDIYQLYPPFTHNSTHVQQAWLAASSDTCNTCPVRFLADYLVTDHSVFLYRFGYNPDFPNDQWKGLAGHAFELAFVWQGIFSAQGWPYDQDLANTVIGYWTDFIHKTKNTKPTWDEYKSGEEPYLFITKPPVMQKGFQQKQCDFWNAYIKTPANFTRWTLFGLQGDII